MERLQLCFGAKSDAKPTQILPWVLCSVTQCQPNGPVSACSEADEGAVCQEKGPAGHSFCASSSPRQTEMQAVLLTLYPAQVWLPCLCCCRSQAVTPVKKAASKKSCWIFPNHGATWLIADFFLKESKDQPLCLWWSYLFIYLFIFIVGDTVLCFGLMIKILATYQCRF